MADEVTLPKMSPAILAAIVREQASEDDLVSDVSEELMSRAREGQRAILAELISSMDAEELLAGMRLEVSITHGEYGPPVDVPKPIASIELTPTSDGWRLEGFTADYSQWVDL